MMNTYTVRFAHLEELPTAKKGDVIFRGDKVGRMGSTGKSTLNHLHIDVIESLIDHIVRLKEIGYEHEKTYCPNIEQLNYFIDGELFGVKPVITTYFYDPQYKIDWDKDHPAYDVVPLNRKLTTDNYNIYWNRSKTGVILNSGFDKNGYGYYILIGFEV